MPMLLKHYQQWVIRFGSVNWRTNRVGYRVPFILLNLQILHYLDRSIVGGLRGCFLLLDNKGLCWKLLLLFRFCNHKFVNFGRINSQENYCSLRNHIISTFFLLHFYQEVDQQENLLTWTDNHQPLSVFNPVTELTWKDNKGINFKLVFWGI